MPTRRRYRPAAASRPPGRPPGAGLARRLRRQAHLATLAGLVASAGLTQGALLEARLGPAADWLSAIGRLTGGAVTVLWLAGAATALGLWLTTGLLVWIYAGLLRPGLPAVEALKGAALVFLPALAGLPLLLLSPWLGGIGQLHTAYLVVAIPASAWLLHTVAEEMVAQRRPAVVATVATALSLVFLFQALGLALGAWLLGQLFPA